MPQKRGETPHASEKRGDPTHHSKEGRPCMLQLGAGAAKHANYINGYFFLNLTPPKMKYLGKTLTKYV